MWQIAWPIVRGILLARGLDEIVGLIERALGVNVPILGPTPPPTIPMQRSSRDDCDEWIPDEWKDDPLFEEKMVDRLLSRDRPRFRRHRNVYTCEGD
jgi:hypothetical protein